MAMPTPEDYLDAAEESREIVEALSVLQQPQYAHLHSAFWWTILLPHCTQEEIADIVGVDRRTVGRHYEAAVGLIRRQLSMVDAAA